MLAVTTILVQAPPDHTATWLAFIGALTVTIIAAATAQWRLRLQLSHGRELADLQDLREVLERLLATTNQDVDVLDDARRLLRLRIEHPEHAGNIDREEDEKMDEALALGDELNRLRAAVTVRLPAGTSVRLINRRIADLLAAATLAGSERDLSSYTQALDSLTSEVIGLGTAAQEIVGSRLPKKHRRDSRKNGQASTAQIGTTSATEPVDDSRTNRPFSGSENADRIGEAEAHAPLPPKDRHHLVATGRTLRMSFFMPRPESSGGHGCGPSARERRASRG